MVRPARTGISFAVVANIHHRGCSASETNARNAPFATSRLDSQSRMNMRASPFLVTMALALWFSQTASAQVIISGTDAENVVVSQVAWIENVAISSLRSSGVSSVSQSAKTFSHGVLSEEAQATQSWQTGISVPFVTTYDNVARLRLVVNNVRTMATLAPDLDYLPGLTSFNLLKISLKIGSISGGSVNLSNLQVNGIALGSWSLSLPQGGDWTEPLTFYVDMEGQNLSSITCDISTGIVSAPSQEVVSVTISGVQGTPEPSTVGYLLLALCVGLVVYRFKTSQRGNKKPLTEVRG